jgi:hypothetical protein
MSLAKKFLKHLPRLFITRDHETCESQATVWSWHKMTVEEGEKTLPGAYTINHFKKVF